MSARKILVGSASIVLDKVVVSAVQLLMVPVLTHAWGLTLFGTWAMIGTIPTFLAMGDFGIVTSAWARMTMFMSRGETDKARTVIHTAWLVATAICVAISLILAAVLWYLPDSALPTAAGFPAEDARLTILMLMVYGLGTIVFRLNTTIFRASGQFPLTVWSNTASYGIENFAVIIAVFAGYGPVVAAAALLAMRGVSIAIVFALSFSRFRQVAPGFSGASRTEWREMWRPALAASLLGLGLMTFLQASVAVLGAVAGAAAVPAFVAVRTISRIGLQVSLVVAQPAAQEFGNEMAKGENFKAGRYFGLVLATSAFMATGMGLGLVLLGQPVIRLWTGGAIDPSMALLVFIALSSFAGGMWNPLLNVILAVNRQKEITGANLLIGVLGLGIIWATADEMGNVSAAIASAIVDGVTLGAMLLFVWRHWLTIPAFREGMHATLADLRRPVATFQSLRKSR